MRAHRLLAISLLAACGDDGNVKPDAGPRIDAPVNTVDAAVDGAPDIDAPPDAPNNSATTRIWVTGDILVDRTLIAAGFDNKAMLPVGTANPPAIAIPAMGELFEGAGSTVRVFDAQAGKIAYVADATVTGRPDLYAANADGSSPVLLVQGQMNLEITAIALSPDGTKVAFTQDSLIIDGGYDLYMVATTNPQTPVKLSPDRAIGGLAPAEQDVFTVFTWSADSKYLSFSADMVELNYDLPYVVDTTAATPAAVALVERNEITAATTRGVRGAILFDSANNAYFRAHLDDTTTQFKLYKAAPTGAASRTLLALPARADSSTPDAWVFGITPDGMKLVFATDAPTAGVYNLYATATAAHAPTAITNATEGRPPISSSFWFSPDSTRVAVVADWSPPPAGEARRNEAYVVHLDGSTLTPRRVGPAPAACIGSCNAELAQWDPDGATLYILGDLVTANDTEVYQVDPTMTDPTPTLVVDLVTSGDAENLLVRPL